MSIYYTENFGGGRDESRLLLKKAIALHIGDSAEAEALTAGIKTGKLGKPYIEGFKSFSVSHTKNIWAVLISEYECGLDIQYTRKCDIIAIADRVYDPADASMIRTLQKSDPGRAEDRFFRIWARREALAKAMGGSAFDSKLPSVAEDRVLTETGSYIISDISLHNIKDLYAAVCLKDAANICLNSHALQIYKQISWTE